MRTVYSLQGDTVDLLCWRYYGSTSGTVEAVLAANNGLSALGLVLPMGTPVVLPELASVEKSAPLLQLFD